MVSPSSPENNSENNTVIPAKVNPKHWVIHGVSYDLESFAKSHPGGEYILLLGQGRDCTELFETVHALGNKDNIHSILEKYRVKDIPKQNDTDYFLWKKNGFYSVLQKKVAERFKNRNYKATWFIWAKLLVLFTLYIYCWMQAVWTGNLLWAAGSGIFTEMIGFCLMHGSSHNAFSKKPILNYIGLLWSPWTMWNHWTWLQHHVYGHHSYTGLHGMDPDIHNLNLIFRKHFESSEKLTTKYQHWYIWPLLILIPGQHLGQIILYPIVPIVTGNIFSVTPFIQTKTKFIFHCYFVMFLSIMFHVFLPLYYHSWTTVALLWFTNMTLMGLSYFVNVLPNHDTETTLQNHPPSNQRIDWGEQQVSIKIINTVIKINSFYIFVGKMYWKSFNW